MSPGSLSFANLVMMSSASANSAGGGGGGGEGCEIRVPRSIQSTLCHAISTPICIRSGFFLRRTQQIF